jgi:glycerol kinase
MSSESEMFVGSVDQGTQSTRFTLYNQKGKIIATAQKEFDLITPNSG